MPFRFSQKTDRFCKRFFSITSCLHRIFRKLTVRNYISSIIQQKKSFVKALPPACEVFFSRRKSHFPRCMQRFCPTVGRFCVQKGFPHLFALQARGKDFLSAKTKRCDLRRNVAKTPVWQKSGRNACPLQCLPPQKRVKKIPLRRKRDVH